MKTLYGFQVIILILPFVISKIARHEFKSICPIPAIDHVIQSRACNKKVSELTDDFGSISGTSGCNSSCSASFFYETSKTKNYMYDIYTTVIYNAANKNRNAPASVSFSADCKQKKITNIQEPLFIACTGMENNGYFSQHWCRNGSDCLESQDCNLFGELHVGICSCKKDFFLLGEKCQQGNLPLGTECDDDFQCPGDNRGCSAPDNSSIKICSCNVGYTDIQNICVKSNLTFNVSCIFDEQCNGTTNSGVCNNRMCDCLNGYYYEDQMCYRAESATDPQLLQVNYENPDSTLSTGHVVGAAVSGFVLGAGVCLVIFWIMKFRQNRRQHSRSPEVQFANNPSYEKGVKINLNDRAVGTPDGKKVSHVRPVIENDAEYSTVESSKHDNDTVYMYNHLHEKGGEPDLDDYDHAQAITDGMATDEYYTEVGTAHTDREAHDVTDREYAVTTGQQNVDDYFTLERQ
ncbi:uncharacterized protein LOC125654412 isoform X2 [Ostrea edulis]|uniref:uncharacterized protein LOC125654412 isoform X2 n=1 Tax=Ostrea edulis TaxID=37623 RepID=UPI0024AED0FC|nr:uncharacterized protein LOC125654412 isoform X2 [Ostrea edulis]